MNYSMCEDLSVQGVVKEIYRADAWGKTQGSIMVDTNYGIVTIPVKDVNQYKINQKVAVRAQVYG